MKHAILFFLLILCACTTTIPSDMHPPLITSPPLSDLHKTVVDNTTEIHIDAQQFDFLPNEITVTTGEKVRLVLTAQDVNHTFVLPAFGINEELAVGEDTSIEIWPNKTGTYDFYCDKPGHNMQGTLRAQ